MSHANLSKMPDGWSGRQVLAAKENTHTNKGIFERLAWLITRSHYH